MTAAVWLIASVTGCGPRVSLPRPHATWVLGCDAPAFDPDGPPDPRRAAIERLLTRGLVEEDSTGRVVPVAAERVEVSPDSLLYTFHLRPGLAFTDGAPCRSAVFRDALRAGLARTDHSTRRWQLGAVRGVDAIRTGRPLPPLGIDTPDSLTLAVRLAAPDRGLLQRLAIPGTTAAWRRRGPGSWGGAVGLGPLRVRAADSLRGLELVRATSTFARPELADTLSVRFAPGPARVRAMLRAARPDLVWPVPPGLLSEPVPASYRRVVQDARPARWLLLVMRADLPPTSKQPARHALGHGINRTEVMRALGARALDVGAWIDGAPAYDFPRLDPQEVELWRERGKLGHSFHVVVAYDATGPAAEVVRLMQGEWAAHAIYVELAPLMGAKRTREFLGGRDHLVLAEMQAPTTDPASLLSLLVMPMRGPAVGGVRTGWRTRDFDAWVAPGSAAARHELAWDPARVQHRLEEERVVLPLARLPWVWLERAGGPVAGFHPRYGPECPTPAVPR